MLNRRTLIAAAALGAVVIAAPALAQDKSIVVASTTSTQDSGLFEYLLPLFKTEDRHHRESGGAGHRPGARHRPARRRRRGVRARQIGGREIPRRRPGREALSGDVQRLRADRAEERSGRHQGHEGRRPRRSQTIKDKQASFISRGDRSGTHIAELKLWKDVRHRHREGQRPLVQVDRPGHGRRAQHRRRRQCLCAVRPRHLDPLQEQGRSRRSWSKATSACSTSTASCW